jgi:lactate permease
MLGREGQVIRRTFFPFVYYALFTASIGYFFVWSKQIGVFNAGSMIATAILLGAIFTIWRGNRA